MSGVGVWWLKSVGVAVVKGMGVWWHGRVGVAVERGGGWLWDQMGVGVVAWKGGGCGVKRGGG